MKNYLRAIIIKNFEVSTWCLYELPIILEILSKAFQIRLK